MTTRIKLNKKVAQQTAFVGVHVIHENVEKTNSCKSYEKQNKAITTQKTDLQLP